MGRRISIMLISYLFLILSCTFFVFSKKDTNYPQEHLEFLPVENFYTVVKLHSEGEEIISMNSASATAISKNDYGTFLLTAGHFCDEDPGFYRFLESRGFSDVTSEIKLHKGVDNSIDAQIIKSDIDIDVCLVFTEEKIGKDLKFAEKMPKVGETIYAISAPSGIMLEKSNVIVSGHFGGCENKYICIFNIPAAPGSSGSLVINRRGEIIGMIDATLMGAEFVSMGPSKKGIKDYIESVTK